MLNPHQSFFRYVTWFPCLFIPHNHAGQPYIFSKFSSWVSGRLADRRRLEFSKKSNFQVSNDIHRNHPKHGFSVLGKTYFLDLSKNVVYPQMAVLVLKWWYCTSLDLGIPDFNSYKLTHTKCSPQSYWKLSYIRLAIGSDMYFALFCNLSNISY